MAERKIIHIDMDAFFASVEQRDDPTLRGKPLAVGSAGGRGVVAAASYEARVFGVRSAMPSVTAIRRCPELIFVPPRFDVYRIVSHQVRAIFADYTDLIEPLSLDEAYLDVTEDRRGLGSATATAEEIRRRIREETSLTASAGVSYNKFVAKLASDQNKPDGLCVITPDMGPAFVAGLPVGRFRGVGPVTAAKMERLGIRTGADLRDCGIEFLARHFGSSAEYFHLAAQGIDNRAVTPDRPLKSVGAETTFSSDLMDTAAVQVALGDILVSLMRRIERSGARGRTVTLKVRYADFRSITRSRTLAGATGDPTMIETLARGLVDDLPTVLPGIRLLGVTLSNIVEDDADAPAQQDLPL
jgi:DNA polymerase-4